MKHLSFVVSSFLNPGRDFAQSNFVFTPTPMCFIRGLVDLVGQKRMGSSLEYEN